MKKTILIFAIFVGTFTMLSAQNISFKFQGPSALSELLNVKVQNSISSLLTEFNHAEKSGTQLDLSSIDMEPEAKTTLSRFWGNIHFRCEDEMNIQSCLEDAQGFEIRGIPVELKPLDNTYKGNTEKEIVISFNRLGKLTGARMALDNNTYSKVLSAGKEITDLRRRREIMKFVEDFYSYYEEKNLSALDNVFSDDALIITGSVVMKQPVGDMVRAEAQIRYHKQDKKGYLANLAKTFANNRYIKIDFDDVKIVRNGATGKQDYYGVTLHQKWHSTNYSDEGYVFLLWDFRNEERPVIHVRTWQPDRYGDKTLNSNDIFSINDFFIP